GPFAADGVMRDEIGPDVRDANRLIPRCCSCRGSGPDHVMLDGGAPDEAAEVDRGLRRIPNTVSGNVRVDLRAGDARAEHGDAEGIVRAGHSANHVDIVAFDAQRTRDQLGVTRARWRWNPARTDADSLAEVCKRHHTLDPC